MNKEDTFTFKIVKLEHEYYDFDLIISNNRTIQKNRMTKRELRQLKNYIDFKLEEEDKMDFIDKKLDILNRYKYVLFVEYKKDVLQKYNRKNTKN